ncbi:hypothetical protein HCH_03064 [Hahella chejuensis KCTC 2396]|uniref:Uncharacterized protein n=1 Tax=Hahella chejuensis (strain KCTC 2396) TaxID=349521 RepID=Q2SHP4_HAHCH|nr:hypothetical protein [Hahella chejuensis]ABC29830.1 hypothetical protein HCH_03064 [Hahella chejuensis KCTC 2396]
MDKTACLKYHSLKMLMTLDLNKALELLATEYGDSFSLDIVLMTDAERERCMDVSEDVVIIKERFWMFEKEDGGGLIRREDLEKRIINEGCK